MARWLVELTYAQLRSKVFLAKYALGKTDALEYYRRALHSQSLSREELDLLHWRRLKTLLDYAYEHSPYYRSRFRSKGLHPSDIIEPHDFSLVPVLKRADLVEHFDEILSDEATSANLNLVSTGGSTGQPVRVYHQRNIVRAAMLWRMQNWWNIPPGSDIGTVYRAPDSLRNRVKSRLISWPNQQVQLDATGFDDESIKVFVDRFNKIRPPLLHGYVGGVDYLASYILDRGINVHSPQAIWTTSAPLTKVQEKRIEKAFGAKVYDQYGCCEVFYLAAECPRKEGLHIFHDVRRIEFLNEQDQPVTDGCLGKVAITDFENMHFPLIRYLTGDIGRALPSKCSCGISLPLMDKVRGRQSDMIWTPSRRRITGEYLTTIFDHEPTCVRQFQVHQLHDYSIMLRVVPNESYEGLDRVLRDVCETVESKTNHELSVVLEKVAQIPLHRGKLRFVISDVEPSE